LLQYKAALFNHKHSIITGSKQGDGSRWSDRRSRKMGWSVGVFALLHRLLCWTWKCLAVSILGLRKWWR